MQDFIGRNYLLIVDVCKDITPTYMDLAHEVVVKLADTPKAEKVPNEVLRWYIYKVAKSIWLHEKRREKKIPVPFDETECSPDPYEYIERIRKSNLTELEKLWLDIYLDHGSFKEVSKNLNLTRQTISKHVREACEKLKSSHKR